MMIALALIFLSPSLAVAKVGYFCRLFKDSGYKGDSLTVSLNDDISDMGKRGFNDKASSLQCKLPYGWKVVLYEHKNFSGRSIEFRRNANEYGLGGMNDKVSSLQWLEDR